MLPDWVSNPGLLTYESDALPIALRRPALGKHKVKQNNISQSTGYNYHKTGSYITLNNYRKPEQWHVSVFTFSHLPVH